MTEGRGADRESDGSSPSGATVESLSFFGSLTTAGSATALLLGATMYLLAIIAAIVTAAAATHAIIDCLAERRYRIACQRRADRS